MITYDTSDYSKMLGNIAVESVNAVSCMGQCTGCKCSCKCSCRNREVDTFEWEEF
ncbi:MAG: FibroRumin family radical SAM-modified Cys-rich RiPP [Ruminococcus sp.]|nr:FibroRumin family radical SAM-modified Cys-rich RiPP [Ruminococcus sp.]